MSEHLNELGQPIGAPVAGWTPRLHPARTAMQGRFCRLEALDPDRHAAALFAANGEDREGRMWTYLPSGPYADFDAYLAASRGVAVNDERPTFAILDAATGKAGSSGSISRLDTRK